MVSSPLWSKMCTSCFFPASCQNKLENCFYSPFCLLHLLHSITNQLVTHNFKTKDSKMQRFLSFTWQQNLLLSVWRLLIALMQLICCICMFYHRNIDISIIFLGTMKCILYALYHLSRNIQQNFKSKKVLCQHIWGLGIC